VWLIFEIALLTFKNRAPATVAALLYALNPFALLMVADIQTEPLHTFLVALGMYAAIRAVVSQRFDLKYAILTGFSFGLGALCRPAALVVGPIVFGGVALLTRHRSSSRLAWQGFGTALATMMLTIAPWTFTNWRDTGEFIIINDGAGFLSWVGNHPEMIRAYTQHFETPAAFHYYIWTHMQQILPQRKINEWETAGGYRSCSLKEREALWRQDMLANLRSDPVLEIRLWGHKLWGYWRPWLHPYAYGTKLALGSAAIWIPLYTFALCGAVLAWHQETGRRVVILVGLVLLISTLGQVIVIPVVRFRLPYSDPYLSVLAGYAAYAIIRKFAARCGMRRFGRQHLCASSG
jgi:hypothetical protein